MEQPPASLALEKLGILHRVFYHQGQVTSLDQAARERNQIPEQVVRSILFRLGKDDYLMVLVAGPIQIPWKALRKYIGQSRLTLASEEEVLAVTGFRIGTVSPFGFPRPIRVILEASVLKQPEVSLGSGLPNTGIIMKRSDLQAALGEVEVASLVE